MSGLSKIQVELSAEKRQKTVELSNNCKAISLEVSRPKCNDILVEVINNNGTAKCKPLNKIGDSFKVTDSKILRFTMNNFSVAPIKITITQQ